MKHVKLWLLIGLLCCIQPLLAQTQSVTAIHNLLNRIGGAGTAERFVVKVDASVAVNGKEAFVIKAENGKPCITGSTTSAVTTGINWYLNHNAHVNLTWNQLTTDLSQVSLPVPAGEEKHVCNADYRYYLNYCTFSYSMSTWTWQRWEQEIDWMALHGINMPLQIVGLDAVWYNLLTKDLGYTHDEANKFIAGPCFQAWWGMNNLEGWGGPNPEWWYQRQTQLAKQILDRQRELGIEPVLPGYSGMVPSDITSKGYQANNQGGWCGFVRPYILDPNTQAFQKISALYYQRLEEIMGKSNYYSMDPFHEGANTSGIDVPKAYKAIGDEMLKVNPQAKWVIQQWQWNWQQYAVLDQMQKGQLIVLDLFSDAHTHFGDYKGHDAVYCALSNFGGRTGLFGRLTKVMNEYFNEKKGHFNVKGIGATPEAIEQVPVLYDALFELAWRDQAPDAKTWLEDYTIARYGADNAQAKAAWEKIRNSALNCETGLQGPHEAVLCGRPWWNIGAVSSWGGTGIFYDVQDVADAAYRLMNSGLEGQNYNYDLVDFTRQALTDYGKSLLAAVDQVRNQSDKKDYNLRRDAYLQLILDLDELLNTNENFMLGHWTQMARGIADEVAGTTNADKEWLELNNARTLITTWGARNNSEGGGLRDYSYREWGGMMKDFYYKRWKAFFDQNDKGTSHPAWFDMEWEWAHDGSVQYNTTTTGNSAEVAARLFGKYFVNFKIDENHTFHIYRYMETNAMDQVKATALRGSNFHFNIENLPSDVTATIGVDFNNDGLIGDGETSQTLDIQIPADAVTGRVLAQLALSDGTVFKFELTQKDEIKQPRTVRVKSAKEAEGKVAIEGTNALSVTHTNEVTIKATPVAGYDFLNWTNATGEVVSKDNPYTYFGAEAAEFTANFIINKWGMPTEDRKEYNTVRDYKQYLTMIKVGQNGAAEKDIYTATTCPEQLCQTTNVVDAPRGSEMQIHWKDAGGMNYCRLSAYIDLNCDGDFEDEGEFLKVEGTKNQAGSHMLHDYTLTVRLPYEVPEGVTHLRLRFDGAWETGHLNSHDAVPAKANTTRFVYEIPVNITTKAATPCTVTVKSADEKLGTVDANGQSLTYTYKVGEEVVLRCYPVEGFYIQKWTDKYGRTVPKTWMDGNFLRFHAPESNTYTAHFTNHKIDQVVFGDWETEMVEKEDGLNLTKITKAGTGVLDLTKSSHQKPVIGIAPTFFHNQTTLTTVVLPQTLRDMSNLAYENSVQGNGNQNAITLDRTIQSDEPWKLIMNVKGNGSTFNQWGSCLLATGTNPFADSYTGGFQLYWQKAGNLVVKSSNANDNYKISNIGNNFTIEFHYDGKGVFTAVLTRTDGTQETLTMNEKLNDFNQLCYGLPQGVDISHLAIYYERFVGDPFAGCINLEDIEVADGNLLFADKNGVLFNGAKTEMLYYPKHRLYTKYFTLKNKATGQYVTATPPADANGNIVANDWNNAQRRSATTAEVNATGLWKITPSGGNKIYHYNSKGYMGGKAGNGGENQILEIIAAAQWAGNYTMTEVQGFNADLSALVSFKLPENFYLSSKDNALKLTATAGENTQWYMTEVQEIPVAMPQAGWTTVSLPAATIVPAAETATVYQATGVEAHHFILEALAPGTVLATGEGVIVNSKQATVNFPISYTEGQALPHNILKGAQARRSGIAARYEIETLGNVARMVPFAGDQETQNNSAYWLSDAKDPFLFFTDYTLSIDNYKYLTLLLDYPVTVPEGVTAYAASSVNPATGEVNLTAVGHVLPANTPAIIYADVNGEPQTYAFVYSNEAGSYTGTNLLKGTLVDSYVQPAADHVAYVMALHKGEIKMMKTLLNLDAEGNRVENGGYFKNRANKAYLEVATEKAQAQALRFHRDGAATGIEALGNDHAPERIFDLQGRHLLKITTPGLYIINGQKQYVK